MKTIRKSIIILVLLITGTGFIAAQSPCPRVGPCDEIASPTPQPANVPVVAGQGNSVTLSSYLEQLVTNFTAFQTAFIQTIEGTLGGYFAVLAYILAWIIAVYYFIQQFVRGEWDGKEIGHFIGRLVICFLLLIFCGDLDGDGRRGDLVRSFGYVGYYLAFGESQNEPTGSFINRKVNEQADLFNKNYQAFVENKLMVKINGQDMPVKYPGMQGIQTVAAVYTRQATPQQEQQSLSQEFWIGLLFQIMNFCRSVIGIIDFFLLALYGFGVLVMVLIAPFMCCVFVNRELAKRFTYPFLWTVFTICVVFPAVSQCARYFAYLSANLALGTSGNPVYTFDPSSYTIIANGDPTPMILVAVLCMLVSIIFLAMSVVLSYALVQGRLVEAMSSLIANTFAGISSVGVGAYVSAMATKMQSEGEKSQIEGVYDSTTTQAGYTLEAQKASANAALKANETLAKSGYASTMTNAAAQQTSAQTSALGSLLGGVANVRAENFQTVNGALANYRHTIGTMNAEERKANADNLIDLLKSNGDATSQRIAKEIELAPEKADLLAEQYENILNGIPIGGSIAKTLGINKDALNSWMRTDGFKTTGQWIFGNPDTMQGGLLQNGSSTSKMFAQNRRLSGDLATPSDLVFQRPDGTYVDAMTGQRLSNNMVDMTNPNNPIDVSKTPSVASMMSSDVSGNMTKTQRANMANLNRMFKDDPNFLPSLQKMAWRNGWNPNDILNFMALETGGSFNKSIRGGAGGHYVGLIQFGEKARQDVGLPIETGAAQRYLSGISATQQLPYIEKYLKMHERMSGTKLDNLGKIYAAVGGGGGSLRKAMHNGGVVFSANSSNAVERAGYKANHKSWDTKNTGEITIGGLGSSAFSKLGAGAYFDTNKALNQIRTVDPATSKFLAKKYSADATYTNSIQNNVRNAQAKAEANTSFYDQKRQVETTYTQDQIDIGNQKAQMQTAGLNQVFASQIKSSQQVYAGQERAAKISQAGSLQAGQLNYQGAVDSAQIQFRGSQMGAQIQRDAALQALYKKNIANLVQSVGGNVTHQLTELFERASRGL